MRTSTLAAALAAGALALTGCGSSSGATAASTSDSMTKTTDSMTKTTDTMDKTTDSMSTTTDAMEPHDDMTTDAMAAGAYLTQAEYQDQMAERAGTKVVYFFAASWCPDCQATDAALMADGVPAGLTVVKIDYDAATDLKRKYGITQQHTFVQVDGDGMQLAKWTGTKDGAAIKAKTV